jgi:Xaa-Pro aminopeptidase
MDASVFRRRRERLQAGLRDGMLIAASTAQAVRNNDVTHSYRQDSDFYYLTGLDEPESALVLTDRDYELFVRPRKPEREIWDGPRAGVQGAVERFGASKAHEIDEFATRVGELAEGRSHVYYTYPANEQMEQRLLSVLARARANSRRGRAYPTRLIDAAALLHEARRVKTQEELNAMRKASQISTEAHLRAMAFAAPGKYEYELQAELERVFRAGGSTRAAYETIVGSGPNTTILHYVHNQRQVQDGDLVLIDAGCEYDYYAADITRTFPANGRFTKEQTAIYQIVLAAQLAAIEASVPGATLDAIHEIAQRVITEGLIELKLIVEPLEEALEKQTYKAFYMHKTGHYLGMDVHDVGRYFEGDSPRPIEPGVVMTVEPGIYIAADNQDVPEVYRGIGVRIEDDILITDEGHENLTAGLAKTVSELEAACAG